MKSSKTRFSATVKNYDQYRPSYPPELIAWIIAAAKIKRSDTVVDIGCGTGISTRLFAEKGFRVIGIDPNEDMLNDARKRGSSAVYKKADAEESNLPDNLASLIVSAQAFHWFRIDDTTKECKRVLKPGGFCCAFWNVRKQDSLTKKYEAIIKKYSGDYEKTTKAAETINAIKENPIVKSVKEKKFTNKQSLDSKGMIGRAYSTSYIAHGVKNHEGFKKELRELFENYQNNGNVTFFYDVLVILWQLK